MNGLELVPPFFVSCSFPFSCCTHSSLLSTFVSFLLLHLLPS
jgi:hypothetical protein